MTTEKTALQELKDFLNKLFQFESQDLDFGIYKILHYKRNEINKFIDELLVDQVKEQLKTLSTKEAEKAEAELEEYKTKDTIRAWVEAKEKNDTVRLGIYESDFKKDIARYKEVARIVQTARAAVDAEKSIYNHLSLFFSRYYDKGDFISKRRFGKNEKYIVPYNGEETHFYWANHDQYYIKSAEHFQKYSFKCPYLNGSLAVHFKLTEAQTEQGNIKADENRYFILSQKSPEISEDELNIYFEYRALSDDEKKESGSQNKQEKLDETAAKALVEKLKGNKLTLQLWKTEGADDENLMLRHIHRYTRRNNYDFFIHKNLKGFLERELDYYIKSELVNVDDLYVLENDIHFDRIRFNFRTIKVFKSIADTIIEFLSQIEEFQKKLWEKKKFVLSTEWVITIDRLVEWLGEEKAKPFILEAMKNEKQNNEWKELFGEKHVPAFKPGKASINELKHDLISWKKFPLDTIHFDAEFKIRLINALSEVIDIEEKLDGLVIHSDNYQGLNQLYGKFNNLIQAVYIDPPYNTNASEIIYKNAFKHSSWNSLISNTVPISRSLLKSDGILCATIDDFEFENLKFILTNIFRRDLILGVVAIKNNPSGRSTTKGFSIAHEYGIFCGNSESTTLGRFAHSEKQVQRYDLEDTLGKFEWVNFRRHGGATALRKSQPKAFYPFYIQENRFRIPEMKWDKESKEWKILEEPKNNELIIWPITPNNEERVWKWEVSSAKEKINELTVRTDSTGSPNIYRKSRINVSGTLPLTIWDKKEHSSTSYGTNVLIALFGSIEGFSFPKSIYAVSDSLRVSNLSKAGYALDYFAGSGTTFHAVQNLNNEDGGSRRCILIEQGDYVYTVIIPRIKKVAYTFDWKEGFPKNGSMNGLGVFIKYQRLEQYEEALENIAFSAKEETVQKALAFKDYMPKYFLNFETRDSKSFLNTGEMADPWSYILKVWDGFTYDTEQAVDMVETFNYLIGLHMQKCITKDIAGRRYQFVYGRNNSNKQILVIWRSVKDWDIKTFEADGKILKEALKKWEYDILYINGQAHIDGYQPIEEIFKNKMLG